MAPKTPVSPTGTILVDAAPPALVPVIITQPTSLTVNQGTSATFSVVADGTAPLTYQWMKDGSPISGAGSASLSLSNVSTTDAGNYQVVVSNPAGSVTSALATLTVLNTRPYIQITSPLNGSTFAAPAKISLVAEAWDVDGSVTQVSFYSGATRIGMGRQWVQRDRMVARCMLVPGRKSGRVLTALPQRQSIIRGQHPLQVP